MHKGLDFPSEELLGSLWKVKDSNDEPVAIKLNELLETFSNLPENVAPGKYLRENVAKITFELKAFGLPGHEVIQFSTSTNRSRGLVSDIIHKVKPLIEHKYQFKLYKSKLFLVCFFENKHYRIPPHMPIIKLCDPESVSPIIRAQVIMWVPPENKHSSYTFWQPGHVVRDWMKEHKFKQISKVF